MRFQMADETSSEVAKRGEGKRKWIQAENCAIGTVKYVQRKEKGGLNHGRRLMPYRHLVHLLKPLCICLCPPLTNKT